MSDHLDQLIRQAASAHLALAPSRVLTTAGLSGEHDEDDLVARALARLDDADYVGQLEPLDPEALMMSESDHDSDRHGVAPPSSASGDDSGLHDIRALAQTAKIRISRKMPTVTDADEETWASTTGQLKAIALPEPARIMMLPDLPSTADAEAARVTALKVEARGAGASATAAAAELTAIQSVGPRKRTGLWLGVAGAAAAAAVVVVVATGGGSSTKSDSGAVAAGPTSPPSAKTEAVGAVVTTTPAPGGASSVAAESGAAVGSGSAMTVPATAGRADGAPQVATPPGEARHEKDTGATPRGTGAGSAAADHVVKAAGPGAGSGAGSGKDPKGPGDKAPAGDGRKPPPTPAATGEKSIDDLLGDATGGSKPTPPGGGGAIGPKPDKKSLDGKDIKAGMGAVSSKAQACFDQHGVAGYVKVKATVDPAGKVIKVDAVGDFAGTPTGACVAAAVKAGASFPPWDGSQMTINYGYTLNE